MKGVQCVESTKPTLYTIIMNEKEKSWSSMRKKITKSFVMHLKKNTKWWWIKTQKKKKKTKQNKTKQNEREEM
jgi:hypothetical protein